MSRGAYISLVGLYLADNSIFDDMVLPPELDRDTFIDNLLLECAELEVLYSDPDFMKMSIRLWSSRRLHSWNKYAQVLYADYDPFINIKRHEVRTISQDRDLKSGLSVNVNAWNDDSSDGVLRNKQSGTDSGNVTTTETFDLEGDSAITDAQDVARKEIELRRKYDLYALILEEFKHRFCLLVY